MSKEKQQRKKITASAEGMVNNAPSRHNRGTFVKLPAGLSFFAPAADKLYRLIFLPWEAGDNNPAYPKGSGATNRFLFVHPRIGPAEETYACAAKCFARPCFPCEMFHQLKGKQPTARGTPEAKAYWNNVMLPMKFKDREMFMVHDLDGPPQNIQVWEEAPFNFGDNLRRRTTMKPEYNWYADPERGLVVLVKGEKRNTDTGSFVMFDNIDFDLREKIPNWRKGQLPNFLTEAMYNFCLDNYVIEPDYQKVKQLVMNTGGVPAETNGEAPAGGGEYQEAPQEPLYNDPEPGTETLYEEPANGETQGEYADEAPAEPFTKFAETEQPSTDDNTEVVYVDEGDAGTLPEPEPEPEPTPEPEPPPPPVRRPPPTQPKQQPAPQRPAQAPAGKPQQRPAQQPAAQTQQRRQAAPTQQATKPPQRPPAKK